MSAAAQHLAKSITRAQRMKVQGRERELQNEKQIQRIWLALL
jgi:hypothetical protein